MIGKKLSNEPKSLTKMTVICGWCGEKAHYLHDNEKYLSDCPHCRRESDVDHPQVIIK